MCSTCQSPLIEQYSLGQLAQDVIYKGIGALCFGCDRVGHRRDGCPYVVCGPKKVGSDQRYEEARRDAQEMVCGDAKEDGYGPWMLVGRRKAGPRQMKPDEQGRILEEVIAGK